MFIQYNTPDILFTQILNAPNNFLNVHLKENNDCNPGWVNAYLWNTGEPTGRPPRCQNPIR